jgi:hypothetical protein
MFKVRMTAVDGNRKVRERLLLGNTLDFLTPAPRLHLQTLLCRSRFRSIPDRSRHELTPQINRRNFLAPMAQLCGNLHARPVVNLPLFRR